MSQRRELAFRGCTARMGHANTAVEDRKTFARMLYSPATPQMGVTPNMSRLQKVLCIPFRMVLVTLKPRRYCAQGLLVFAACGWPICTRAIRWEFMGLVPPDTSPFRWPDIGESTWL